jgi:thiol-disulfide isomerase/thioredoxin
MLGMTLRRSVLIQRLRQSPLPAVLFLTSLAACTPGAEIVPAPPEASAEARRILEESAATLLATPAVEYDFEWGSVEDPTGWITGHTTMRRVTDATDSMYRVDGLVHAQPDFGVEELAFSFATDGEQAWATDSTTDRISTSPVGAGANTLSSRAVYGFLPEFIEARPFWKELTLNAEMSLLEPQEIDDELCDVVRVVVQPENGPPSEVHWSIGQSCRLPHRGRWLGSGSTPEMNFTITALAGPTSTSASSFRLAEADAVSQATGPAVGDRAPDFALETPDGETVRLADLAGRVIVLDFWNTWCYLCRSMAPETRRLADELSDRAVQFFGVNVFETGDPVEYWQGAGNPYPLLLAGDELAQALDLPWQPGVAVLGSDGTLLFKELGASPDRAVKIRAAVEQGLASFDKPAAGGR